MEKAEKILVQLPEMAERERFCQLYRKLQEYKTRVDTDKDFVAELDTFCKIEVLNKVLSTGELSFEDYKEIEEKAKNHFEEPDTSLIIDGLLNAVAVIEGYIKDGGKTVTGGTSLR